MALLSLLSTHSHDQGWSSDKIITVIINIGDACMDIFNDILNLVQCSMLQ